MFVAYVAYHGYTNGSGMLTGMVSAANSKIVSLFPVADGLDLQLSESFLVTQYQHLQDLVLSFYI